MDAAQGLAILATNMATLVEQSGPDIEVEHILADNFLMAALRVLTVTTKHEATVERLLASYQEMHKWYA